MRIVRSDAPSFLGTIGQELPWEEEAIFTKVLMHDQGSKAEFHKIDLFHTVTLGVGKTYAANCLAIMQEMFNGTSIDERLREMTSRFLEFCRDTWLNYAR